jgi:decaprenylphospho-beta-D-ribofuranose 2-oxidase
VVEVGDRREATVALDHVGARGVLARGLGRSYGDAAQNGGGTVLELRGSPRIDVDTESGLVRASAGATIDDLIRHLVPLGWFVPVTPGTRQVTVGGAVAADIHGKNHHADGSWGHHVRELDLLHADGTLQVVSPTSDPDVFWATTGGMGLTGMVLGCLFQALPIETSRMLVDTRRTIDLDETMSLMTAHDREHRYTVAWIDSLATGSRLGRGVVTMGDHAPHDAVPSTTQRTFDDRTRLSVPNGVPGGLLNRLSIAAFNELWYRKAPRDRRQELQGISEFFHPLDMVADWNRLYGPRGMLQYQVVVPMGEEDTLRAVVERLALGGAASFLTVLKRFGPAGSGHLSFPIPGWTLTLDIPTGVAGLGPMLDDLDRRIVEVGGRIYLAKDSRVSPALMPRMYPRLDEWRAVCDRVDPERRWQSDLSRRLGLRESLVQTISETRGSAS